MIDVVGELKSLRGTPIETEVQAMIKTGIDYALAMQTPPLLVAYEAMAQGLSIMTGKPVAESRETMLGMIGEVVAAVTLAMHQPAGRG